MKWQKLNRSVDVQASRFDDPVSDALRLFFLLDVADPHFDHQQGFPDFESDAVHELKLRGIGGHESQQDIFPDFVALVLRESEDEAASVEVGGILPDRLHVFPEEIEVGVVFEIAGSLEMLID